MQRLAVILMLASLCLAGQSKSKASSQSEVQVLEVTCRRQSGDVLLDGRVKNNSLKPLIKLQLLFDFLGTDRQVLTTKRGELEQETLDPGQEAEFHLRVGDPVRAVSYMMRAEDGRGRDLRVENSGPFPIE